jgi:hypothetical protein
VKQ